MDEFDSWGRSAPVNSLKDPRPPPIGPDRTKGLRHVRRGLRIPRAGTAHARYRPFQPQQKTEATFSIFALAPGMIRSNVSRTFGCVMPVPR